MLSSAQSGPLSNTYSQNAATPERSQAAPPRQVLDNASTAEAQPKARRLRTKVLVTVSLAVAALITLEAAFSINAHYKEGFAALHERGRLLSSLQADALAVPVWDFDSEQIDSILDALAQDPDFFAVTMSDATGTVIAERGEAGSAENILKVGQDIVYAQGDERQVLGRLDLQLSTSRLDEALLRSVGIRFVALALLLVAVLSSIILAFRRITNPLDRLTSVMSQLAAGNHSTIVPDLERDDEIGGMARAVQVFKNNAIERERAEARMHHMALHDALTDLPNRILFHDRLKQAIANARRHRTLVALVLVDLDWFKDVNDTFGHAAGDQLLKTVAKRLNSMVRASDVVARLGGDEFALVLSDLTRPEDAEIVTRKVIAALDQPIDLGDSEAHTPASVGITVFPNDGDTPEQLLQNADVALYRAKAMGRSLCCRFDAAMGQQIQTRKSLEQDLRQALTSNQFQLHYQPQLDLASGEIVGVEALLRWHHPERGPVSPTEFIPIAEETGLIVTIGDWVLEQACRQASTWQKELDRTMTIAVNLSAVQFKSDIATTMIRLLHRYQLSPKHIELEITERILMRDTDANLGILRQLSDIGICFSMDDFGTGYASLSYLRRFPFSKIKIDQSFVRDINTNADAAAIVRAVIGLGSSLEMVVTAEGVETEDQLNYLQTAGCTQAQGYFIGKPVPADVIARLFSQRASREAS